MIIKNSTQVEDLEIGSWITSFRTKKGKPFYVVSSFDNREESIQEAEQFEAMTGLTAYKKTWLLTGAEVVV